MNKQKREKEEAEVKRAIKIFEEELKKNKNVVVKLIFVDDEGENI